VHDISFDVRYFSLTSRVAVSKKSYEAGFDATGSVKQKKAVDEAKVSFWLLQYRNSGANIDGWFLA
jgi:hypothetical protein